MLVAYGRGGVRAVHVDSDWLVAADVEQPYRRDYRDLEVEFIGLSECGARVEGLAGRVV
jgi:hypothetical protein